MMIKQMNIFLLHLVGRSRASVVANNIYIKLSINNNIYINIYMKQYSYQIVANNISNQKLALWFQSTKESSV